MTDTEITPAPIAVSDAELDDLRGRLVRTRWPDRETVDGWGQGVPLAGIRALCDHWLHRYDWRRCEAMLNGWRPSRTTVDGLGIHYFHVESPEPDALPVVMTHGWPGSAIEFHKVVSPLNDPRAHGGDPADALHLVLPALPGFGFSGKPREPGWGLGRIADAWTELMRRLGYGRRWAAQGGDWGGEVAEAIGARGPAGCVGLHLNHLNVAPTADDVSRADARERALLDRRRRYDEELSGYLKLQSTRPQTVGYGLADSPAGQAS